MGERPELSMFFCIFGSRKIICDMKIEFLKRIFPKFIPAIVAAALFFVVCAVCFAPQFEGRVLAMHDIQQFDGMSSDIRAHRAATGEDPQWTGNMFGGMPAYLINIRYPAQFIKSCADKVLGSIGEPLCLIFFAMFSMWIMVVMMGISPWIGIIAALAYGLSTYFFLIIGAGHITKMWAAVYAPAMMGAIYMTLRGRKLLGGALAALFAALEIGANHPQITYYFLLAALALWVNDLVFAWKEKHLRDFGIRTAVLAAAAILAVGANFSSLFYTMQHSKDTIRGGSEALSALEGQSADGLDLDYATAWSYGITESWTMLVPDFMGGESGFDGYSTDRNAPLQQALKEWNYFDFMGVPKNYVIPYFTDITYWGTQPYTAGPTYLGAVAIFLALLGLLLADKKNRWWIVAISIFALLLSWGSNAMWFTKLCYNYLPMYNKFRTVSMALVVLQWSVPLLAALALWHIFKDENREKLRKALLWSGGITIGILLLFSIAGSWLFDFGEERSALTVSHRFEQIFKSAGAEDMIKEGLHDQIGWSIAEAVADEREQMMSSDAIRSLIFVVLAAAVIALLYFGKLKRGYAIALLSTLIVADMVPVAMRFLSHDDFVAPRKTQIVATDADKAIAKDKELGFRVLNLSVSPFNDATTSMFHRSVGGYHGAKLGRYQDIIDYYLPESMPHERILDMLNTKYIISPEGEVVLRDTAFGAAWFVDSVLEVRGAAEEIQSLGLVDLASTAVVAEGDAPMQDAYSTEGWIKLVEYAPNRLKYEYNAEEGAFAVFSEIFYDKGWSVTIDGQKADALRVDYILRGMQLPAGRHRVEWSFKAPYWGIVEAVTLICSLIVVVSVILVLIFGKRYER